jgi:tRNA (guanine-N7-)-methyltransferase
LVWTAEHADDWRRPWGDYCDTRYEAKAKREGRAPCYLTFRRTIEPAPTSAAE